MQRSIRIVAGALLWSFAALALARLLAASHGTDRSTLSRLIDHFGSEEMEIEVAFSEPVLLEVGDDVDVAGRVAGEVKALLDERGGTVPDLYALTRRARIRLHDVTETPLRTGASARLVRVPQTAVWVVDTLLTEKTIPLIAEEWNRTMLDHRDEIFRLVTPIVRDVLLELERHIEAELPHFIEAHREEIAGLGRKLEAALGGERLANLFERELWPLAQPRLRPIIEKVGRELWDRVPLWGFSWRLAYQSLPLTENDHLEKAWVSFLESHALPVFREHADEVLQAMKDIFRGALRNPAVAASFREAFSSLLADPGFHSLCQSFVQEMLLDHPGFHEAMRRRWQSPEVRRALEAASAHVEPMVRRMGDIVLGTREEGITREFARVLRSQILLKDLQRIELDPGPDAAPVLARGSVIPATVEWEMKRR